MLQRCKSRAKIEHELTLSKSQISHGISQKQSASKGDIGGAVGGVTEGVLGGVNTNVRLIGMLGNRSNREHKPKKVKKKQKSIIINKMSINIDKYRCK